MNLQKSRWYSVTFLSILFLAACTQEQEIGQTTVSGVSAAQQVEAEKPGRIEEERTDSMKQQTKGTDVDDQNQISSNELWLDIDERRAELESHFSTADLNDDGYLELHELPHATIAYVDAMQNGRSSMLTDETRSTASLEKLQRDLEQSGKNPEDLLNIRDALKQRFDNEFDTADVDNDGRLSRTEYHNRVRQFEEQARRQYFSNLDSNQDGFVDWLEYSNEIQKWKNLDENRDGLVSREEHRINWLRQ